MVIDGMKERGGALTGGSSSFGARVIHQGDGYDGLLMG